MIHKFSRLLMTLVALFVMTAGAWAQEGTLLTTILSTGDNASFKSGSKTFDNIATVTFSNTVKNYGDEWGWYSDLTESLLTVAGINGYTITSCKFYAQDGTADYTVEGESPSVYLSGSNVYTDDSKSVKIGSHGVTKIEVYGYAAPAGPEVTWNAATKTGTFDMPASDVVLTPLYATVAQWATESDVELLPTAAEGIFAGTDAPLIKEGTGIVAFAGTSTEVTQGQVMYAVTSTNQATAPELSAFSATVPTAENIADEGDDVLVWYYIQGADAPDGQEATAENTFNDSEICATPLEVSVLSNQFDITLNAANANTIEGQNGKGTVTVKTGDADAVDKTADIDADHKLKAVKMGSTVTINAKQGYKFRKVEAKKAAPALKTLTVNGMQLKYVEGDTWQQAIERPENEGSGWRVQNNYIYNGGYTLFINEGTYVYVRPGDTIDATKNYSLEAD